MRKIFLKFSILTYILMIIISCNSIEKKYIIKGKTIGVNSKSIILLKAGEDFTFEGIDVPVIDSLFECEIEIDQPEAYSLMLGKARQGGGRFQIFFVEPGEIQITLYPEDEFDKNIVLGGKLNKEYKDYLEKIESEFDPLINPLSDSLDILFKTGNYFSEAMRLLQEKSHSTENFNDKLGIYEKKKDLRNSGMDLSNEARKIKNKLDEIFRDKTKWQHDYISQNLSIVSYFLLYNDILLNNFLDKDKINLKLATSNYQKLSKKYPNHPYTESVGILIESLNNIKVGGTYINFSAPDLTGNVIKLSEVIEGKIALIDLWATWCGSCIAHSRSMIPVYEEFKDSGFTIIGVAGEYKNTDRLRTRLEKEKFPWLNLVELDKQNRIWDKYGIPNLGGKTFLVDKDGSIIAIHPTVDEVREKLNKLLY